MRICFKRHLFVCLQKYLQMLQTGIDEFLRKCWQWHNEQIVGLRGLVLAEVCSLQVLLLTYVLEYYFEIVSHAFMLKSLNLILNSVFSKISL